MCFAFRAIRFRRRAAHVTLALTSGFAMSSTVPAPGGESASPTRPSDAVLDRLAVEEQLDRVLASPLFRHSKRCSPLLRYVVLETLDGRGEALKERALGIAVFGRKATYDTNDDPIVRSSAAEVRKRIAQYYHEPGHETEVRIELTSGSYVPHFHAPTAPRGETAEIHPSAPPAVAVSSRLRRWAAIPAILLLILGAVSWWAVATTEGRHPDKAFWGPLIGSPSVILASGEVAEATGGGPISFAATNQGDRVGFADGLTMARVAALLGRRGATTEIRRAGELTLADLRRAPAILIGEMSNPWARLLEVELRFRFEWDLNSRVVHLVDQQRPGQPLWSLSLDTPYAAMKEDRAIITRVVDPRTEHAVLILAGCGRDGTIAAGEFVSEARYLELLGGQVQKGWSHRNLQVVIATDLIHGHSGPPRIIATHSW